MKKFMLLAAMALCFTACDDSNNTDDNNPTSDPSINYGTIEQKCDQVSGSGAISDKITQIFSNTDNIESVRVQPGSKGTAIVVASKGKVAYQAKLNDTKIESKPVLSLSGTGSDDELTNSAVINETDFVVTHTIISRTGSGDDSKINGCYGEIIIYDGANCKNYRIPVGPMPDAVAVTPDKKYIITADELDSTDAWGKCPVDSADKQGISIIDISAGYEKAKVVKQIKFTKGLLGPREPEYIAIGSDSDSVLVNLQDSDEIAVFSLKKILAMSDAVLNESVTTIKQLPANASGNTHPWPDGVTSFDANGKTYFAIAGEWNDTLFIVDQNGENISQIQVTETEVPTNFPCVDDGESPKYSTDSITSYTKEGKVFIASTLRFAGAIVIYDVTDPSAPVFVRAEKVGETDSQGCSKDGSKVYPEGISAGEGYIWVANEGESSVTVIKY